METEDCSLEQPCLEIDPSDFVIAIAPSFVSYVLSGERRGGPGTAPAPKLPAASLSDMIDEGVSILLSSRHFESENERLEFEQFCRRMLLGDPLRKLISNLHMNGGYIEWLRRCFMLDPVPACSDETLAILKQLLYLQERGALLLYTGYDDALSKLSNLQVVLPEGKNSVVEWARGERRGLLHVHGVYCKPESLQFDCEMYDRPVIEELGRVFQAKHVVSFGAYDTQLDNPILVRFSNIFLPMARDCHSFHFPLSGGDYDTSRSGTLRLPWVKCNQLPIAPIADISKSLCREIDFPSDEPQGHQTMALLVTNKSGASEIAKMMFSCPGVTFALMSTLSNNTALGKGVYTISLHVKTSMLGELWAWLWGEKKSLLVTQGLVAMVMQSGTIIWVQGISTSLVPLSYLQPQEVKQEPMPPASSASTTTLPMPVPMEEMAAAIIHQQQQQPAPKPPGSISPLVRQEFPKPGMKKVSRYTVHKFHVKPGVPGNSLTLPALPSYGNPKSSLYLHGFSDDTNMYSSQNSNLSRNMFRRCSLPPIVQTNPSSVNGSSDSMLFKLAENCQSSSSELHPPSYTAIKQALLCDKYKRRQSMQTDPKTLKNLLQTKLVISEKKEEDLIALRRKSDPGSYMKQRDFERRKELFLDENLSWSRSYGKVIDNQIQRWQRQRQEKQLQRNFFSWQKEALSSMKPLKINMINPLLATQAGIINPLMTNGLNNPTAAIFQGSSAGMVNPYILPPQGGILSGTGAATTTPIYYNPFGSPYTLVSPYSALQLGQAPPSTTYLMPQSSSLSSNTQQPSVYYYIPNVSTTTTSTAPSPSPLINSSSSVATATMSPVPPPLSNNTTLPIAAAAAAPNIGLFAPPTITTAAVPTPTSPPQELYQPRPISPNSRKRHQSVPEKLTSLLQPPLLMPTTAMPTDTAGSGSGGESGQASPIEMSMDSDLPPSSKKQRSTSDTTVYYTPFGFSQHSPGGHSSGSSSRQSISPQPPPPPPPAYQINGLSPRQTHLLQVKTAVQERQKRKSKSPRASQGHSPRRKYSGGVVKTERLSPPSEREGMGQEQLEGLSPRGIEGREASDDWKTGVVENGDSGSHKGSPNENSRIELWQFLLELLVSPTANNLLQWTDEEFEFQISKPVEVSQLWGQFSNNSLMTYERLASHLSEYFNQGILSQVQGRKLTFKFAGPIRNYVQMRRLQTTPNHEEVVVV